MHDGKWLSHKYTLSNVRAGISNIQSLCYIKAYATDPILGSGAREDISGLISGASHSGKTLLAPNKTKTKHSFCLVGWFLKKMTVILLNSGQIIMDFNKNRALYNTVEIPD